MPGNLAQNAPTEQPDSPEPVVIISPMSRGVLVNAWEALDG